MEKFYAVIACCLLLFSCSIGSEELTRSFEVSDKVIGKWNYTEQLFSSGASGQLRRKIENDEITLEFLPDAKLVSVRFFECDQASYQIEGDLLRIDFACEAYQGEREYRLSWKSENLVLNQLRPVQCIEGCAQIFRKILPTKKD